MGLSSIMKISPFGFAIFQYLFRYTKLQEWTRWTRRKYQQKFRVDKLLKANLKLSWTMIGSKQMQHLSEVLLDLLHYTLAIQ